jgi:hypothetical protein
MFLFWLPDFLANRYSLDLKSFRPLLVGLATAGHQAFSANLLTLPSDLLPRSSLASVICIGGTVC